MTSDTSLDAVATATLKSIDGMVFGRKAHELLAGFWPTAGDARDASPDLIEQAPCSLVRQPRSRCSSEPW